MVPAVPGHLAAAAREDQYRVAGGEQPTSVLTRPVHGAEARAQTPPARNSEVLTLAKRTDADPGSLVDIQDEKRDVEESERRVVDDE